MSIVFALIAAMSAQPTDASAKPICQKNGPIAVKNKGGAGIHRLDQEPPAKQVLTVVRTFEGCSKPVVVREDIGARKR